MEPQRNQLHHNLDAKAESVDLRQHYLEHQELLEDPESLEDKICEDSFPLDLLTVCCCCWPDQAPENTQHTGQKR